MDTCFDSMAMPKVRFARLVIGKTCLVAKLKFSILVIENERSKLETSGASRISSLNKFV